MYNTNVQRKSYRFSFRRFQQPTTSGYRKVQGFDGVYSNYSRTWIARVSYGSWRMAETLLDCSNQTLSLLLLKVYFTRNNKATINEIHQAISLNDDNLKN